jgi:ATP-binding cassette subfamily F protein uup
LTILFRNPNFLILDEPTNDLDLPTLSVLENFLLDFGGCLLIVSHDRYFMDRLVDHLFIFEGDGIVRDFPGNYSQYRETLKEPELKETARKEEKAPEKPIGAPKKKLSYKEQREFELLEKTIQQLEKEKQEIYAKLGSSGLPYEELQKLTDRISIITSQIDEKELRWLELSENTF